MHRATRERGGRGRMPSSAVLTSVILHGALYQQQRGASLLRSGGVEEQRGGRGRSASAGMCCRCVRTELLCSRRASDSFINITCSISGASPSSGEWESVSFTSSRRNVSKVKSRCVRVMLSVLGRELVTPRFTAVTFFLQASQKDCSLHRIPPLRRRM